MKLLIILICVAILLGCGEFSAAMELQDQYASNFTHTTARNLELAMEYFPTFTRGTVETLYSAFLPSGEYVAVASSAGRVFYQAPTGFAYRLNATVKSTVGGIVQIDSTDFSRFYVWYFPESDDHVALQPNGKWIDKVKPGLSGMESRPWVEGDLVVEIEDSK